jgi:hypothetical protein
MEALYLTEDDYEQISPPQGEPAARGLYTSNPYLLSPASNFILVNLKNLRTEIIDSMDSSGDLMHWQN